MSFFPRILDPPGDEPLAGLYAEIQAAGFGEDAPLNWFTAQSLRPDILASTFAFCRGVMLEGQLPPTIKQMIVVLVSELNGCTYCRLTHRRALEALDVPRDVIDSLTTGVELSKVPPQQRAILQFAAKASQSPLTLEDGDFEELRDYGLTDGELIEIAMTAALTNFINIWAHAAAVEVDEESAA